jgi:hypothetical protein
MSMLSISVRASSGDSTVVLHDRDGVRGAAHRSDWIHYHVAGVEVGHKPSKRLALGCRTADFPESLVLGRTWDAKLPPAALPCAVVTVPGAGRADVLI